MIAAPLPLFVVPEPVSSLGVALKVAMLLALAWAAAGLLRGQSASTRHLVWASAIAGSLALAVLMPVVPRVPVSVPIEFSADRGEREAPAATASGTPAGRSARGRGLSPGAFALGLEVLSTLWLAGAAGVGLWLLTGHLVLARHVARSQAAGSWAPWLEHPLALGPRAPRVRVSDDVRVPLTWGWLDPVVLMPAGAAAWPAERIRAALLHERAHVARRDNLTQGLANLACVVFWFDPLVWLAARRLRSESERACDDRVLAAGLGATEYAAHLVAVARAAWAAPASLAAAGMTRDEDFERRIAAILDERRPRPRVGAGAGVVVLVAFAIVLAPLSVLRLGITDPASRRPPHIEHPAPESAGHPARR